MSSASARSRRQAPHRDIRDLVSYRLARLVGLNDRTGHAHLSETFGLTLGEWRVFATIASAESATLASLARQMLLDKGQLSRTVAQLVERGWVESNRSQANRRGVDLRLSAAGRDQHARIYDFVLERNRVMLAVLTDEQRGRLHEILDHLTQFVEAEFKGLETSSAREAETAASRQSSARSRA